MLAGVPRVTRPQGPPDPDERQTVRAPAEGRRGRRCRYGRCGGFRRRKNRKRGAVVSVAYSAGKRSAQYATGGCATTYSTERTVSRNAATMAVSGRRQKVTVACSPPLRHVSVIRRVSK